MIIKVKTDRFDARPLQFTERIPVYRFFIFLTLNSGSDRLRFRDYYTKIMYGTETTLTESPVRHPPPPLSLLTQRVPLVSSVGVPVIRASIVRKYIFKPLKRTFCSLTKVDSGKS